MITVGPGPPTTAERSRADELRDFGFVRFRLNFAAQRSDGPGQEPATVFIAAWT